VAEGITLNFVDLGTSDAAVIVVRPTSDGVGLAVSLRSTAQELARALIKIVE
jgi:hypothetical protein